MTITTALTASTVTRGRRSRPMCLKRWPHLAAGLLLHPGFDVDRSLVDTCEGVVARVVSERAERENQGVFPFSAFKKKCGVSSI